MAREPTDALEMIQETDDVSALSTLHGMLTHVETERTERLHGRTDVELNAIFVGPVERRIEAIKAAKAG